MNQSNYVEKFTQDGYVVLRGYLSNASAFNAEIEKTLRSRVAECVFHRYEKRVALDDIGFSYEKFASTAHKLRVPEIHTLSPDLLGLINDCGFETKLPGILAANSELLQSLYFQFSSEQASHSDKFLVSPRPYVRETLCGVWLALDNTSDMNGALFGWAGSHRVSDKPLLAESESYGAYSRDLVISMVNAGLRPAPIYAEAGDVIVWANDFVHGGQPPHDPTITRRSLVLHYGMSSTT